VRLRAAGASYVTTSLLQAASQLRAIVGPVEAEPQTTEAGVPPQAKPAVEPKLSMGAG